MYIREAVMRIPLSPSSVDGLDRKSLIGLRNIVKDLHGICWQLIDFKTRLESVKTQTFKNWNKTFVICLNYSLHGIYLIENIFYTRNMVLVYP